MKKSFISVLALIMTFSLCACSGGTDTEISEEETSSEEALIQYQVGDTIHKRIFFTL
jgi:uncharacterized lipoprotein YehR (DUF1307 family)